MTQVTARSFKDFGIKPKESKNLIGEKIAIKKILNKLVSVEFYRIEPSKYPDSGNVNRLNMQIVYNEDKRVVFTGSKGLMDVIQQIPPENFPFETTIIEQNEAFFFS